MSLFVAWVVFPLILLALCVGLGLLVDLLGGRRLPGVLVPQSVSPRSSSSAASPPPPPLRLALRAQLRGGGGLKPGEFR